MQVLLSFAQFSVRGALRFGTSSSAIKSRLVDARHGSDQVTVLADQLQAGMVCSFVPFRSREHDENTLRTAHPAVIFASHMCLVCGWVWVLDMNTRQQYMKPFYTGTLDINRSQTVPDPGTIGAVPDSIISTNTIHAHHPACKVLQLHLPCTNPAFMQMECIVKT